MQTFDVTVHSDATPELLWWRLVNPHSWPEWSPVDALVTHLSDQLDPEGVDDVGATRAFRTGRTIVRERITALRFAALFRYEGVDNPALDDYTAAIELEAANDGGTTVRWHGTYIARRRPRVVTQWYLRRFMRRMADGLAAYGPEVSRRG